MAKDAPGMKGYRPRNDDGDLRRKRGDAHVENIENQYGVDFGVRSDMHLETLLNRENVSSLNKLLQKKN